MVKSIVITFMMNMAFLLYAMENAKKICYLALIPHDMQKRILFYVKDDETKKEFIKRIKRIQPVLKNTYNRFIVYADPISSENDKNTHNVRDILRAVCPDRYKLALLPLSCNAPDKLILTLVDKQKKQTMCAAEFDAGDYRYIALSRGANIIAAVEHRLSSELKKPAYGPIKNILIVKNLVTNAKGERDISDMYEIFSIAFDKQGTSVIVRGEAVDGLDIKPVYKIFSIKDIINKKNTSTVENVNKEMTLQKYFNERRICKCIANK